VSSLTLNPTHLLELSYHAEKWFFGNTAMLLLLLVLLVLFL